MGIHPSASTPPKRIIVCCSFGRRVHVFMWVSFFSSYFFGVLTYCTTLLFESFGITNMTPLDSPGASFVRSIPTSLAFEVPRIYSCVAVYQSIVSSSWSVDMTGAGTSWLRDGTPIENKQGCYTVLMHLPVEYLYQLLRQDYFRVVGVGGDSRFNKFYCLEEHRKYCHI